MFADYSDYLCLVHYNIYTYYCRYVATRLADLFSSVIITSGL